MSAPAINIYSVLYIKKYWKKIHFFDRNKFEFSFIIAQKLIETDIYCVHLACLRFFTLYRIDFYNKISL